MLQLQFFCLRNFFQAGEHFSAHINIYSHREFLTLPCTWLEEIAIFFPEILINTSRTFSSSLIRAKSNSHSLIIYMFHYINRPKHPANIFAFERFGVSSATDTAQLFSHFSHHSQKIIVSSSALRSSFKTNASLSKEKVSQSTVKSSHGEVF